jgi:group I intron endonuclease
MSQGIIYLITNKINGHKYVGQTTQSMNKRWSSHIRESSYEINNNRPLYQAFQKYGIDNFNIKQIDECDISLLNEREIYWINHYNTFETSEGYNATSGGGRPIFSQKTKDLISTKMGEIERNEKWVENIKKSLSQKYNSEPWGFLLEKNRGNGEHHRKRIQGTHIETGEVKEWNSISEAAIELTGNVKMNGNISRAAKHGYMCRGYKWKILEEKETKRRVFSINKKTGEMGPRFSSVREAARSISNMNNCGTGITKSLKNPGKYSWKGYYWYYG